MYLYVLAYHAVMKVMFPGHVMLPDQHDVSGIHVV